MEEIIRSFDGKRIIILHNLCCYSFHILFFANITGQKNSM